MSSKKTIFQYFGKLILESNAESDRAVAILMSAELDELLRQLIEKRLIPHNKQAFKKVSDTDIISSHGAIGSFAARIDLGYRLGLLDSLIAHDLHLIRKIRNLFAHETHGLHFEQSEPKKYLAKSKIAKLKPYGGPSFVDMNLTKNREAFCSLTFFLLGHLGDLKNKTRRLKEKKVLSNLPSTP